MNNDAEWFRNGMLRCSEDHARVIKVWTRFIIAGWILMFFAVATGVLFLCVHVWFGAVGQLGWSIFIGFKLKDAYDTRTELADSWLRMRNVYSREYELRK